MRAHVGARDRLRLRRAVALYDRDWESRALLGDAAGHAAGLAGDRAEARTAYRRALALKPDAENVRRALSLLG